jgi:hypothetical protein
MDSTFTRIQRWYAAQCDGDWEHEYGIRIETIDNPGWRVRIHLEGTDLAGRRFAPREYGLRDDSATDWHRIWVENNCFEGAGDPSKLEFILGQFLDWAALTGAG